MADLDECGEQAPWLLVTGLASRLLHDHLASFTEWTYSTLTIARGKGLSKMLVQGGVGGSTLWGWIQAGSLPMKIGRSKKFNASNRIVDFHSRAPASLHTS